MTWVVHSSWLERQFDGTDALDLDGAGANTINMGIVTEAAIDADTDSLYSGLTPVDTGTEWTGPVALANITCGLTAGDLVFDADDPSVIDQDAGGGFEDARSLVLYDSASSQIIAHHTEASTFGNVAGAITISLDADGIWVMSI